MKIKEQVILDAWECVFCVFLVIYCSIYNSLTVGLKEKEEIISDNRPAYKVL